MEALTGKSHAKVNLTLRVLHRRPDGFHEIESLMARVGLCDTVTIARRTDDRMTVTCDDPAIPCDESNLALRAARALLKAAGRSGIGLDIALRKRIPAGAGLGGGSSNGATVLRLVNRLCALEKDDAELARIGTALGSDVPFFLNGPLCVARGRGERLEAVTHELPAWIVLCLPEVHASTSSVYAAWDPDADRAERPSIERVLAAGANAERLMDAVFNDLTPATLRVSSQLAAARDDLRELAGSRICMSGTGSTFYRMLSDWKDADRFAERVRAELGIRAEVGRLGGNL